VLADTNWQKPAKSAVRRCLPIVMLGTEIGLYECHPKLLSILEMSKMNKVDRNIWLVLFAMQCLFCITFLLIAYDGSIEVSAICSDRVSTVAVKQDVANTTPMTVEQQIKLRDQFNSLVYYMRHSINDWPVLARINSLLLAVVLLLSIGAEAIIFWRTVRRKQT
jgi:hypothetical protein